MLRKWTEQNEIEFLDMQLRRAQAYQASMRPLQAVVAILCPPSANPAAAKAPALLTQRLIDNADAVRDALRPFDSGLRVRELNLSPDEIRNHK